MSDQNDAPANTTPEPVKTKADRYADFMTKQGNHNSLFDTRGMKPVTQRDVGLVTGKINKDD